MSTQLRSDWLQSTSECCGPRDEGLRVRLSVQGVQACGKQDCTFIPALAVPHDLLKTDVLKARSESEASFFRRGVTEQEEEYGSDCKPSTLPILHKAACLPSCGHLACACSWPPR